MSPTLNYNYNPFSFTHIYNRSSLVDLTSMIIPPFGVIREVETNN
jgi:hypothetical protein